MSRRRHTRADAAIAPRQLSRPRVRLWLAALSVSLQACSPQQAPEQRSTAERGPRGNTLSEANADDMDLGNRRAPYPLTMAPLTWSERQKLLASDGAAEDAFGFAGALDGNTAIVGANADDDLGNDSGSAYAFVRSASTWTEQQKLLPNDGAAEDEFGYSVSLSDNTALVGSLGSDVAGAESGAAYVFVRAANLWSQEQKLVPADPAPNDYFGIQVALSNDSAIVGASANGASALNQSAAYIFTRSANSWTEQQKLVARDDTIWSGFGQSVSISGDTAIVGAHSRSEVGSSSGAAYVFMRNAGTWTEQQKLVPDDGAANDRFGHSVALSGDTTIVGAFVNDLVGVDAGAAYVFVRNATAWTQQQRLLATGTAAGDHYGSSVTVSGDTAVVGAYSNDQAAVGAGSAYVFVRDAATWTEMERLVVSDSTSARYVGRSVSANGDAVLAGAAGSAYVFALRLVDGEPCTTDGACASKACTDGYCCQSACAEPCERCDRAGLEGLCTLTPKAGSPDADCQGHLCNGLAGTCPAQCGGDGECASDHHCTSVNVCRSKSADGLLCAENSHCLSGHCVNGLCCAEACDGGCGSCLVVGLEGLCTPHAASHPGTPSCAPSLCNGSDAACPKRCDAHADCSLGAHCDEGSCQLGRDLGSACEAGASCASDHCTDAICCAADSCGAYRCGSEGTCPAACGSSAQCAAGHECTSGGRCRPRAGGPTEPAEGGACTIAAGAQPSPSRAIWLSVLACLACAVRTRRHGSRPRVANWRSTRG